MSSYFNKRLKQSFDEAIAGVTEELKKEGFSSNLKKVVERG